MNDATTVLWHDWEPLHTAHLAATAAALSPAALATEFNTDPKALGYAAHITSGDDQGLANIINAVEPTPETGPVTSVTTDAILKAIQFADWPSSVNATSWLQAVMALGRVNPGDANVVNGLGSIFAGKATTLANLTALKTRSYTRAEILFGAGTVITALDVARAFGRGG